jgi:hypothetical protein
LDEEDARFDIPLAWIGAEDLPVLFVNQIVGQVDPQDDAFFLTLGQTLPPALIGTLEERVAQAEELVYVPVKPVVRLSFTRRKLEELVAVLQTNLDQHDQIRRMRGGDET